MAHTMTAAEWVERCGGTTPDEGVGYPRVQLGDLRCPAVGVVDLTTELDLLFAAPWDFDPGRHRFAGLLIRGWYWSADAGLWKQAGLVVLVPADWYATLDRTSVGVAGLLWPDVIFRHDRVHRPRFIDEPPEGYPNRQESPA